MNISVSSTRYHTDDYTLFTNVDVRLPKMNTTQRQEAFYFRGARVWNSLPIERDLDIGNWS